MTRQEAEDLLPWFVNGTLSTEESHAVQAFIDSGEISQREVDEVRLFAETIQEQSADEPVFNPAMFDGVMAKLDSVQQEVAETPVIVSEPKQESEGFLTRLMDGFSWSLMPPLAKVAVAGQFAVVVALSAALLAGGANEETSFETVSGSATATAQADVQVVFSPTATEQEIRALLNSVEGIIVSGPSALGVYEIDLAEELDSAAAVQTLNTSPTTQIVQQIDPE